MSNVLIKNSVYNRALADLVNRKDRAENGLINCIRLPFPRLRKWWPGTEKGRYIIVSANQKVGKSKLSDYLFVYDPFFYYLSNPEVFRLKVFYFTMETSKEEKFYEFLCHLLYKLDDIRIDPLRLKSTDVDYPCPQEILDLLNTERYQKYIKKFDECVIFIDNIRNPTGINKYLREYATNPKNGTLHTKDIETVDNKTGLDKTISVIDYYEPTDPDEVRIVIQDNFSNLTLESGMNKMQNIDKMSKYNIILRDQLNYTIVAIQHQSQAQEGIENFKLGKLKPSADGLADCKTTIRDKAFYINNICKKLFIFASRTI